MLKIDVLNTVDRKNQPQFKGKNIASIPKELNIVTHKRIFIGSSFVGNIMSEMEECVQKQVLPFFWKKHTTIPGEKISFQPFIYLLTDDKEEIKEVINFASRYYEGRVAALSDGINNKDLEQMGFKPFLKEKINNIETRLSSISKPEHMPKKAEALRVRQYEIANLTEKLNLYKECDKKGTIPKGIEDLLLYRDNSGIIY